MPNSWKEKYLLFQVRTRKDPEAFAKLYDLYVDRIYRFLSFKLASEEDARDITSEVFLRSWQHIHDGKTLNTPVALFYRIARNLTADFYRSKQRSEIPLDLADEENQGLLKDAATVPNIANRLDIDFKTRSVLDSLHGLKENYRELIVFRYLDELSTREIGEILGKTEVNVRVMLHRSLRALRTVMAKKS